ncbi:hypothetical protein CAPTEDRAFT_187112 [Capitella teleta]|uniref:Uncharacterized protein n=1 Tax=Capitella teleta TaxID=283909 RepID=R7V9Y5_CAPTE|nr:hypothetical protein CAPTEDRAFT_187112 [Capitella teleta]|eukprot:ELU15638.1 hypothetical protein CAPTEDRAFT_187112 [Capitella teleta]
MRVMLVILVAETKLRFSQLFACEGVVFTKQWSVELMALSSIDRINGGVCLEKFIYYGRKAFMVKFVHENDDREYIKVMKRKNLERFKQLGLKILFATVAPNINTIV